MKIGEIHQIRNYLQQIVGYMYTDSNKVQDAVREINELLKQEEEAEKWG